MSIAIFSLTSICLILSIILKPKIKKIDTYVVVTVVGALLMIIFRQITFKQIYEEFFNNPMISPIKILILFFTMTFLSVVCDNLGFFNFLAYKATKLGKSNQLILFTILFFLISIVTIFTSNDIIILTFTPFIISFTKRANISPIPYLIMEFTAANTASMALIVGNPTNIVLAFANSISFIEYFSVMWLVTLVTSIFLYCLLIIIFRKDLTKKINVISDTNIPTLNKFLVSVSLTLLLLSTILLALSNYLNIEMYLITSVLSLILLIFLLIYYFITKKEKYVLISSLKRLPYALIPFLLSMFILVGALKVNNVTNNLYELLNNKNEIFTYGISSFLMCNIMNNIPMSILYSNILTLGASQKAIYATIISSNIGAYLTPLGALAGIMWISILKMYNIDFKFSSFTKYGVIISIPVLLVALFTLFLIL